MITTLTPERLISSVLAVPPLCRNVDLSITGAENLKLIRHIESGGVSTLIYGGNANFYHVGAGEYDQILSFLQEAAGGQTLVIPSVGPTFGTMMDQAKILRKARFPIAMILPMTGAATPDGVEAGVRRFTQAAGIPALLYLRADGYVAPEQIRRMIDDKTIVGVKYAVVRDNPANDPYLAEICRRIDPKKIVSGLGEQPAIIHMRDFGVGGFTAGVVCVAPRLSAAMLKAIHAKNWCEAEKIRELCAPLENIRNAVNPIRVLHEAVRLAGIADTGPMLPLLSNLPEHDHTQIRDAALKLLELDRQYAAH
jgi:dihydrodipicolinate synthase/N-acetylneuraminate lyase